MTTLNIHSERKRESIKSKLLKKKRKKDNIIIPIWWSYYYIEIKQNKKLATNERHTCCSQTIYKIKIKKEKKKIQITPTY
jgi:hypothetical protein